MKTKLWQSVKISSYLLICGTKIQRGEQNISSSSFYEELPDYWSHVLALS